MSGLIESLEKAITKLYRKRISRRLYEQSSRAVEYGPFKGMKLIAFSHISSAPLALKLFGLYEPEVTAFLTGLSGRDTLINVGAGDGYYSVGLIKSGTVRTALSFELDERGRRAIAENAAQNGMADRIRVYGAADDSLPGILKAEGADATRAIFLSDIEGAEFSVISDSLIAALPGAAYAIEIHTFAVPDGERKFLDLKERLGRTHVLETVVAGPRDWRGIRELEALHDNARALVTSDGRKELGLWLFAMPKGETAS